MYLSCGRARRVASHNVREAKMRFEGRTAIITGSGSGLGRVLAHHFAAEGASVIVADIVAQRASAVASEIADAGGTALPQTADVTSAADVEAMVGAAREALGPADILVNNAAKATDIDFLELPEEAWDEDVAISLKGAFLCSQAVLKDMIKNRSGVILNISTVNALAYYGNEAYSAGKAGLLSLTRSLAARYGPFGVRANAIAPGTLRTSAWEERRQRDPDVFERLAKWYPLGRVGEPEDVAGAALFLASDEAAWISGALLPVDGGLTVGNLQMVREIIKEPDDGN
jgi:meso-butanediol dehydrogenase / (S,S)-butanediol dehydrogenase / diacetyl reductase